MGGAPISTTGQRRAAGVEDFKSPGELFTSDGGVEQEINRQFGVLLVWCGEES